MTHFVVGIDPCEGLATKTNHQAESGQESGKDSPEQHQWKHLAWQEVGSGCAEKLSYLLLKIKLVGERGDIFRGGHF